MVKKAFYTEVLGLSDYEVDELMRMAGEIGLTVPDLLAKFSHDLVGEEYPDDPERADFAKKWMKKMHVSTEPTFLSYLMGLNDSDLREAIDCLLFLKQKQDSADKIDTLLKQIEDHAVDEAALTKLKRICGSYGIDVDKENIDAVKACLEEEKRNIRADMYIPDLGFEPDNLYSAPDVVKGRFDDYRRIFIQEDADMTEELRKVLAWIEENEKYFQPID